MCTRTHGTLDYIWGTVLIASPWLFDFVTYDSIMWVPVLYGGFVLIYSFFTTYEWGRIADITMKTHLWLDRTGGIFVMLSPWLFGFAQTTYVRSEEHTLNSSHVAISYAVFCLKK